MNEPWSEQVVRHFRSLMRGASLQDWLGLLRYQDFAKQVYVLDQDCMTVSHPFAPFEVHSSLRTQTIPWHVVLLLGKYHRKHIFHGHRLPRVELAMREVNDFLAKLKWQWYFRGEEVSGPVLRTKRRHSGLLQPPPTSQLLPELQVWTNMFARTVERALKRAKARAGRFCSLGANTVLLEVEALRSIQKSGWLPLPTDKDGGYCIVQKAFVREAQKSILAKSWYEQVHNMELAGLYKIACVAYRKLAKRISDSSGYPALYTQLCKSLRGCTCNDLPRKLSLTVKTHKPPGSVSFRNLHVGGPQPFGGLSIWLNLQLDRVLRRLPHVLSSTHDLANRLREVEFDFPIAMARIDVKDFFMSGTCSDFVTCAELFPADERKNIVAAIEFLLGHQFFVADAMPHTLWQVKAGTGMGLIHSSQLCDLAYYKHAEFQLVDTSALAFFGVALYLRFRDDIFVIYNARENKIARFVSLLKSKAQYVQLQVESISEESAVMLDLCVRVCKHQRHKWSLEVFPHFKPTSLQVPLSCSSFHNPSIHVSWPFNQLRRLASLCSNEQRFQEVKKVFLQRFQDAKEPCCLVSALHQYNPWPVNKVVQRTDFHPIRDRKWLVLPYHPVWNRSGLKSEIAKFVNSDLACRLWGICFSRGPPEVGIAWRNGGPPAKFVFCDTATING